MYYQVGAATIRQIPYPGSGTNFPYTEKPRNPDPLVLNSGAKIRRKFGTNLVRTPYGRTSTTC